MPDTNGKPSCTPINLRTLLFVFLVLGVLGLTNVFLSTSSQTLTLARDVTWRFKSDISNALKNLFYNKSDTVLNGNINETKTIQIETIKSLVETERISALNQTFEDRDRFNKENINPSKINTVQYDILGNPLMKDGTNDANDSRKDDCNNCFKHDFKYLIYNTDVCKLYSNQTEVELLIIILSTHNHTLERQALRETWLTPSKNNTATVRYAFLFGKIQNAKLQESLVKESEQFRDIVQEDFIDVYSNLTYKTLMGFKWAASNCGIAKAVLKTDDDMYINVPNVMKIVKEKELQLQTNVFGSCNQKAQPVRDTKSKWFASVRSYPGKFYAGFCSGTGYLTSLNVARKVFEISRHVPFFHLEDVYVALCMKKLGYGLKNYPGFYPYPPKLDSCLYNGKTLVTAHYMTPKTIRQMWIGKCTRFGRKVRR